jgi:LSD1 subclass zinc finger protein
MVHLAICLGCRTPFALLAPAPHASCPLCQHDALVGNASEAGILKLFHEAVPFAVSKKQKREILALAKAVIAEPAFAERALREADLSPETRSILDQLWRVAGPTFNVVVGLASIVSLVLFLVDRDDNKKEQAELMAVLRELVAVTQEATAQQGAESPKPRTHSKDSRAQSLRKGPGSAASAKTRRPEKAEPSRRRRRADVPLGD